MVYEHLKWDARKLGLLILTPGQCAWLSTDNYADRMYCPMDGGDSYNRDSFNYIDEKSKKRWDFATESDLSWSILRRVPANTALTAT
ncbi:hypothetical protein [Streptomyces sp. NPDC003015]